MERKARTVSWGRRGPFEATPLPSEAGQPEGLYKPFPAAWPTGQTCSRAQLPPAVSSNNKRVLRGTLRALMGLNDPVWLHLGPQPHHGLGSQFQAIPGPQPVPDLGCCWAHFLAGPLGAMLQLWLWPCQLLLGTLVLADPLQCHRGAGAGFGQPVSH